MTSHVCPRCIYLHARCCAFLSRGAHRQSVIDERPARSLAARTQVRIPLNKKKSGRTRQQQQAVCLVLCFSLMTQE